MNRKQLGILNSLLTYTTENLPGGLTDEETEVVKIVAKWSLAEASPTHIYTVVNLLDYGAGIDDMAEAANRWASLGWRVVGVVSDTRPKATNSLVLERPVGVSHPDD